MSAPRAAAAWFELLPGAIALPHGLLWLERSRAIVAADAHLAYEDVIGGALPLWSTTESLGILLAALARMNARELIFLGDIIHGSVMSDGAERIVRSAIDELRARAEVTLVAGNHEGRTRGRRVLGDTVDGLDRDGWRLVHGDEPGTSGRTIIGHLHPSISLGGDKSAPSFLANADVIVVPALTPYSRGLSVLSASCTRALRNFTRSANELLVVASAEDRVYPFGALGHLRDALRVKTHAPRSGFLRARLRAD